MIMNRSFSSARWLGRLTQTLLIYAKYKNIRFNSSPKLFEILTVVLNNSNNEEQSIINGLLEKFNESSSFEKENNISLNQTEFEQFRLNGIRDIDYLIFKYSTINNKALEPIDFCLIFDKELEELKIAERANNRKKLKNALLAIAIVVLGIWIYNLEYFQELRMYNKVVDNNETFYCHQYYESFPNGRHYEDVMMIEANVSYTPIRPTTEYLRKFPNGKYQSEMNHKCDSLWDSTIEWYNNINKNNESLEAVSFMNAMLQHMKKERISTVKLKMNPSIQLKDYIEYDESTRLILELLGADETLPLKSENILSLKENFTSDDRRNLFNFLSRSFETSFENIFTSDYVDIVIEENSNNISDKSPIISCNYTIKNVNESISEEIEIPSIWTYTSNHICKAYILAIDVMFDAQISIPGSNQTYSYSEIGKPGEKISGIENIKDGYRKMTQVCFNEFAQKMSINLGLRK